MNTNKDRKMEDRKMFTPPCGASSRHRQLFWHDVKRHLSVLHFSVLAFVQVNLTLPS
ncbi:hypothetical protein L0337_35160 [candidate division KSB1 bacterium]|nr:hypothetical protein [candidate division KSB1 bacterium]